MKYERDVCCHLLLAEGGELTGKTKSSCVTNSVCLPFCSAPHHPVQQQLHFRDDLWQLALVGFWIRWAEALTRSSNCSCIEYCS